MCLCNYSDLSILWFAVHICLLDDLSMMHQGWQKDRKRSKYRNMSNPGSRRSYSSMGEHGSTTFLLTKRMAAPIMESEVIPVKVWNSAP